MRTDTENYLTKTLEPFYEKLENLDEKWGWNDFMGLPFVVPSLCGRVIHVGYSGGYVAFGLGGFAYTLLRDCGLVTKAVGHSCGWVLFGHKQDSRNYHSNLAKRRWAKLASSVLDLSVMPIFRCLGGIGGAVTAIAHPGLEAKLRKEVFLPFEKMRCELEIAIEENYPKKNEQHRR